MNITRRGFLKGIGGAIIVDGIARGIIMPVKQLIVPDKTILTQPWWLEPLEPVAGKFARFNVGDIVMANYMINADTPHCLMRVEHVGKEGISVSLADDSKNFDRFIDTKFNSMDLTKIGKVIFVDDNHVLNKWKPKV